MGLTRAHEELLTAIAEEAEGLPAPAWRDAFTLDPDSREAAEELERMGYMALEPPGKDRWFVLRLTEKGVAAAKGFAASRAHMEAMSSTGRVH